MNKIANVILDILFPPLCLNCRDYLADQNRVLCEKCFSKISVSTGYFCPHCGKRLPEANKVCHADFKFIAASVTRYGEEPLTELVKLLKYRGMTKTADLLGELVFQLITGNKLALENYIIVPIPLHSRRLRKRGFNQSEMIAQKLVDLYGAGRVLMEPNAIQRIKPTRPQVEMSSDDSREENVRGCFAVKEPQKIKGKNILLVDDVFTSGATLNEAAIILKQAGARKILAVTVLRG